MNHGSTGGNGCGVVYSDGVITIVIEHTCHTGCTCNAPLQSSLARICEELDELTQQMKLLAIRRAWLASLKLAAERAAQLANTLSTRALLRLLARRVVTLRRSWWWRFPKRFLPHET